MVFLAGTPSSWPPLSPSSPLGNGTKGFVELMRALGSRVVVDRGDLPPLSPSATVVVLSDSPAGGAGTLSKAQRTEIERFVVSGGHLVVADSSSPLASLAKGRMGQVWQFQSPVAFTNESLGTDDDATVVALAAGAGSKGEVVMVFSPPTAGGSRTLFSLLDMRTRLVIGGLALAVVVLAAGRGRRLGDPVEEEPLVAVDSVVTIESLARLMERAGVKELPT
jgi:hypothetical protein